MPLSMARPAQRLDNCDLAAELVGGGSDFEADPAATDHEDAGVGREIGADRLGVADAAQVMDAGEFRPRYRQAPNSGSGGDHQTVIRDRLAAIDFDRVLGW
jgi:hypothetical protein